MSQRIQVTRHVNPPRMSAHLGPVSAWGATEDEALRALATLLRAHASQIETQADRASGEAALLSAGMVG